MKFNANSTMREQHTKSLEKWFGEQLANTGNTGEYSDYDNAICQFEYEFDKYGKLNTLHFTYSMECYTIAFKNDYEALWIYRTATKHDPNTTFVILEYTNNEEFFDWLFRVLDYFDELLLKHKSVTFKITG